MTRYNTTADTTYITADSTRFTADIDASALPAVTTPTSDDYMALLTPWQASPVKAKFLATVRAGVQPYADAQAFVASLPEAFDIDEAIGAQLDVDGQWVGRTRNVPTPIPNSFFSFGVPPLGFGLGYWKGPYDSGQGISQLPDSLYRPLLYAKILSNSWDGTTDGALATLNAYLGTAGSYVFIQDEALAIPFDPVNNLFAFGVSGRGFGQGVWAGPFATLKVPDVAAMAYRVCIAGKIPSDIDLYILGSDLLAVRAMGVDLTYTVTTVDRTPLFGFGMDSGEVAGFGKGAWGADPFTVAALTA